MQQKLKSNDTNISNTQFNSQIVSEDNAQKSKPITIINVSAPEMLNFEVRPKERIKVNISISSKVIFCSEIEINYLITSFFSPQREIFKILTAFRSPQITLSKRIEKLGSLPRYSKLDFSLSFKNWEEVDEYMVLRPLKFEHFTDEILDEIFELYTTWITRQDIYCNDFMEESEIAEINSLLTYYGKEFALKLEDFVFKISRKSSYRLPLMLDNLFSQGK